MTLRLLMKKIALMLIVVLFAFCSGPLAVNAQISEEVLKAVFLERLTRFISWPPDSDLGDTSKSFVITVLGKNTLGPVLDQLYSAYKIRNKFVELRYISDLSELNSTDLLFVSTSKKNEFENIIKSTRQLPVLLVGDTPGFAEMGGHINLFLVNNKLRFEVNEKALVEANFKVSYLLLRLAKIVNPLTK